VFSLKLKNPSTSGLITIFLLLSRPMVFLLLLILTGSAGYILIENWSFVDSLYMTIITITTVGFGEVGRLSVNGKIFTMALICGGVVFYGFAINGVIRIFIERRFKGIIAEFRMKDKIKKLKNHYIICGGGRMGCAIAKVLEKSGKDFVIIESHPDSLIKKNENEWLVLMGDALQEETLIEARISHAAGIATVLSTDADNLFVVLSSRGINSSIWIETRISDESSKPKMIQAGANKVISPYDAGGSRIARSLINPEANLLRIFLGNENYDLILKVEKINPAHKYFGKTIADIELKERKYSVIGLKTPDGQIIFAPKHEMELRDGFELLMLEEEQEIESKS
jgi:voltage-gated potassium channel